MLVVYVFDLPQAVFVTSLTTLVAFFMTSISNLVNIQAFGLYAGMNIFFLFTLTILLLPPTLVVWERNFSHLPCCVCHSACLCCGDLRQKTRAKLDEKEKGMAERSIKMLEMPPDMPPSVGFPSHTFSSLSLLRRQILVRIDSLCLNIDAAMR